MNYKDYIEVMETRRSIYALSKDRFPYSNEEILSVVRRCAYLTPSGFHTQSARALVLFDDEHRKLWSLTEEILSAITDPYKFKTSTQKKMESFKAAKGTILFFDDHRCVNETMTKFAEYGGKIPDYVEQSQGMFQVNVWNALAAMYIGANLQHYNPLIDGDVRDEWGVDPNWILKAQMVFGSYSAFPPDKPRTPEEERAIMKP